MYKIFLCLRYLRTRYIVLASIISVMLGVATMIVVNSVMSGFANEMQTRIHGIMGDLMVTSTSSDGFYDPEGQMQRIRDALGDKVIGMTPICTTVGVLTYKTRILDVDGCEREAQLTEQVCIVGVDEKSKASVGDFGKFLQHPENRKVLSFALREGGYSTFEGLENTQSRGLLDRIFPVKDRRKGKAKERADMKRAGWAHRRDYYGEPMNGVEIVTNPELHVESKNTDSEVLPTMKKAEEEAAPVLDLMDTSSPVKVLSEHPMDNPPETPANPFLAAEKKEAEAVGEQNDFNLNESLNVMKQAEKNTPPSTDPFGGSQNDPFGGSSDDPFGGEGGGVFDPLKETHPGIIIGMGMAMYRTPDGTDKFYLLPGRDVMLTFPDCSIRPTGVTGHFTCVDLYESKMSEYDSQFVFVSMQTLQELRGMPNKANQIQIQLEPGSDLDAAREELQKVFDPQLFVCKTWRDDKMPLLQAVDMEIAILNVLLFMIIAVSGFGILAIFYMVVTDKTRDIGILKALGASSWGIMSIFLMYGLSLGIVGAGLGMILGLAFVLNINEVADFLSWCLGHEVFSPDIYYFYQVPYDISLATVAWIVGGALFIAVLASVFPAWHASRLQPVESLRYE